MIVFVKTDGRILGAVWAESADVVETLTLVPEGTTPLYLDDIQHKAVWDDAGNYIIENGTPVYSQGPISPPQPPSEEQRLKSVEDAITVLMGL